MVPHSNVLELIVAFLAIVYVAFCFFYGLTSLKSRRATSLAATRQASGTGWRVWRIGDARAVAKAAGIFLMPVFALVFALTFVGRERSGVIEATNLFVVPPRPDGSVSFLTDVSNVTKGQVVARFSSDALEHRIKALRSKRDELVASRKALGSSPTHSADVDLVRQQAAEQRLLQLEQKLADLARASFSINQQLLIGRMTWQRTRDDLQAKLPDLEQSAASETVALASASRALARIRVLRDQGFATITQLDQADVAESMARQRWTAAGSMLESANKSIATLETSFQKSQRLLQDELRKLDAGTAVALEQRGKVEERLTSLRQVNERNKSAAVARRRYELTAASARIAELDNEIAAALAQLEVKAPVNGRVLYRNATSSTLTGALPLLVIAPTGGFLMRVDLVREEASSLRRHSEPPRSIDVLVDDGTAKRLIPARLLRIDDQGFDPKRVTAIFGIAMPEDMLVRMALRGTAPRGSLRWAPSPGEVVFNRIQQAMGFAVPASSRTAAEEAGDATLATDLDRKARPVPVSLTSL